MSMHVKRRVAFGLAALATAVGTGVVGIGMTNAHAELPDYNDDKSYCSESSCEYQEGNVERSEQFDEHFDPSKTDPENQAAIDATQGDEE
jgi:hypothetical protein